MITIDEMQNMLDELAEELPPIFFEELNGGILLLPKVRTSDHAQNNDLYVLGEYRHQYSMGRYIIIYYGSFELLFPHLPPDALKAELRKTLRHEFTHHLESLAGENDLEKYDASLLGNYLSGN
ncbi:MAG: metallopeptidase family protein [Clostridiales Family XIII bacterium]|jgi:hypothetical protein|nr:metallopeptidase family protein [Clostridiales Family XIII bacterium]